MRRGGASAYVRTVARAAGLAAAGVLACVMPARADARPVFQPVEALSLDTLEREVRAGAPAFSAARRDALAAEAESRQARLYENPTLDAAWGTVPVGQTNPADLSRPFARVPNYAVGLGYTFPVGKRPARRTRADALTRAAGAEVDLSARELALSLAEVLGQLATATLRRQGIGDLVAGGKRAIELAEARVRAQFGAPLDVDQIRIEVERTEALLAEVDSEIERGRAECAALVGVPCRNFESASAARAYLARWFAPRVGATRISERADLRALAAYGDAASAEARLARATRLPDPTVRLGYVHDRFLVSGNQLNSLNLSVSVPLPVFDRGQVRAGAADTARRMITEERARRLAVAEARAPALESRLALSRGRCQRLEREVIPSALKVLTSLETAAEARLLPLTQVIQSRRIVSELFIEEAESCGEAYVAALALIRERPPEGELP
ncbi:MAG: TolC family protein [Polyangiales bacterium]